MFRFREKSTGPFADTRSADRWLASLPANDPLAVQRAVLPELVKLAEPTARRTIPRLKAVFAVDAQLRGQVANLMTQYAEHSHRSPKIEKQLWQALFDLTQGYQACYAAFAREIDDGAHHGKWHALLPELIARQITHLADDARIRLYRCDLWIPAKWAELHAPFARACSHRMERLAVPLNAMAGPTTIEHEYLVALVLQLADPGNLTPKQVEWVATRLDEWCQPLRLSLDQPSNTPFYVDLAANFGLRRRGLGALEGRVIFVDLEPLHLLLRQNRAALEQALRNNPHSDNAPAQRQQLELHDKLASRFSPEFKPLPRHGARKPASGAVDAIIGFGAIQGYLHEGPASPTDERHASRSFGNTMELAIFGRTRIEQDDPGDAARRRIATFAAPGGSWQMKDISSSGFRLHAPMSVATEVTLSMLVAIHQQTDDAWVLGIVRRMRRLSANNADIGLQLIANALVSADLFAPRKSRDAEPAGRGMLMAETGHRFRGILLSLAARPGEAPTESLIIPPSEHERARLCQMQALNVSRPIRFGRLIEQHADWVWTAIEPIAAGGGTGEAPPAT